MACHGFCFLCADGFGIYPENAFLMNSSLKCAVHGPALVETLGFLFGLFSILPTGSDEFGGGY